MLRLVDFFDAAGCFCAKIRGPILGPVFGLHFLGPGLEILAPGFPSPLIGPHSSGPIFGTQKRTLFEAEQAPIQDPKHGPILEPKTARKEYVFSIRSQKKSTGHCMILVPRLSGIMCLPVRCCAALQCRHPCSVETVTSY